MALSVKINILASQSSGYTDCSMWACHSRKKNTFIVLLLISRACRFVENLKIEQLALTTSFSFGS